MVSLCHGLYIVCSRQKCYSLILSCAVRLALKATVTGPATAREGASVCLNSGSTSTATFQLGSQVGPAHKSVKCNLGPAAMCTAASDVHRCMMRYSRAQACGHINTLTCDMLAAKAAASLTCADALVCVASMQSVQHTAFKPEMLAPASLQLVAPNAKRQPKRVSGTDGRSASASVQFEPKGLPTRTNAQMLGAFTNRALSPNKLCFSVSSNSIPCCGQMCACLPEGLGTQVLSMAEHMSAATRSTICSGLSGNHKCFDNASGAGAGVLQGDNA